LNQRGVIFFDLDGTLTDPNQGIVRSVQFALKKLHQPILSEGELTWFIGPPLHESFRTFLGDEPLVDEAITYFREYFSETGIFENKVYPDIPDVLEEMTQMGCTLFVATSKPQGFAEQIIDHFSLSDYFEKIFGSQLDGTRSDKSELLKFALKETNADPLKSFMIGDRRHDVVGAINNQLTAIGILYGYGTHDELIGAGAHFVAETPNQVLQHITVKGQHV
jgi:phosphoglycolate phosphatase